MTAFTKLNGFAEHLAEKVHDFGSDTFIVALSNTAPGSESTPPTGATTACILANVTQISYTNCSARTITITSSAQTSGTEKVIFADLTLTASGGDVGPFRYIYIYNDTPTSPVDPLVGYYDYGAAHTITSGNSFVINFDGTGGFMTLA